jgi:UDP:flavonoid glycosyltransferase YjiC (YdhE family)
VKVLFCAIPGYGHVLPLLPLAEACQSLGYDTSLATGQAMVGRLPVETVHGLPDWSLASAERETRRRHPELGALPPRESYRFAVELFADVTAEGFISTLDEVLEEKAPDLVVYEVMAVGAALAASRRGVPCIGFGVVQWSIVTELLHRAVIERHGLDPSEVLLTCAYLDPFPPSIRSTDVARPANDQLLRPVPASLGDAHLPDWLLAPKARKRVYLTLGTVAFGATDAFEAALDVLDDRDVDVLVAVGPDGDPSILMPRSERIHVETFVDQGAVLPLVDAVVHHGGSGTMLSALASGRPQVVMPQGADQFHNAATLPATGAGRAVFPGSPRTVLTDAIHDALADPVMEKAARRIADEIEAMPSPIVVASGFPALV